VYPRISNESKSIEKNPNIERFFANIGNLSKACGLGSCFKTFSDFFSKCFFFAPKLGRKFQSMHKNDRKNFVFFGANPLCPGLKERIERKLLS